MGGNVQKKAGMFFRPHRFFCTQLKVNRFSGFKNYDRTFLKVSVYDQCFGLYLLLSLPCNVYIVVAPNLISILTLPLPV